MISPEKFESIYSEIEAVVLKNGAAFNEKQKEFILNNETSFDLVACAGSGKTTALIAKLLLLERFYPENNVCVLTHTNVAIDEVKEKISLDSSLLREPNYFGTIQQFVDQFLTIPAYRAMFKRNLKLIDTEQTNKIFLKRFFELSKTDERCNTLLNYRKLGEDRDDRVNTLENGVEMKINSDGSVDYFLKQSHPNAKPFPIKQSDSASYKVLHKVKSQVMADGYITYNEAFVLAERFMEKYPFIKLCINTRFSHLFIDEVQDTSDSQFRVLESLFDESDVVVQYIGDPNQTIYDNDAESDDLFWKPKRDRSDLKDSLRFSASIATAISGIRVDQHEELIGNKSVPPIAPQIILFNDNEESRLKVFDAYRELIQKHIAVLNYEQHDKIKIIGWTGRNNNHLCIPAYFPSFNRSNKNTKVFSTYKGAVQHYYGVLENRGSLGELYGHLVNILGQFVYHQNIRNNGKFWSRKEFADLIESKSDLSAILKNFSLEIMSGIETAWDDYEEYIKVNFKEIFGGEAELTKDARVFFDSEETGEIKDVFAVNQVLFDLKDGDRNIIAPVDISTVHSVKGETHKSSLYLETRFHENDLEEIMQGIAVGFKNDLTKHQEARMMKRRMVAYVGMSRASHLLCVAMRKSVLTEQHIEQLIKKGWEFNNIDDLL